MQTGVNKKIPKRSLVIILFCMAAWCAILIRLFYLQVISYNEYQQKVVDNIQRETSVMANRGVIYDSSMNQLATNITTWRIFVSPRDVKDETQKTLIATKLSEILSVSYDGIIEKLNKTERADETIKKDIDETTFNAIVAFIEENDLDDQIHYESYTKRYYPYGSLASNVIGFCGTDGGLLGLENYYDGELSGISGKYITARDANGVKMPYKYDSYIEAENGSNLVTTINMNIQSVLENQLEATYYDSEAIHRVCGIVMNPNTGEVYGMGVYPNFNLNDPFTLDAASQTEFDALGLASGTDEYNSKYWEYVYGMWKNKAVSELYEPGSTFKVITTAMALEDNVTTFQDTYYCPGLNYYVEGYSKPIGCHYKAGHGYVTYARGLQQSCNPTLMQVAAKIGGQRFYDYFIKFGYTERCGIDLPGEADTIYTSYSNFNQVELAVYSFGQTFKVTPIQHLTAVSAVANGGYLVTPHVVSKIVDDDGNVIKSFDTTVKRQVVSSSVCSQISQVLEEGVSTDGGAKNAYVAGYKIAAKTGTSQVRDILDENGESYLVVGSTVAYAPSDNPEVAVLIMVDAPQCASYYGSYVAAPYVANIMEAILPMLGVERIYTEDEAALIMSAVSNYVGWGTGDAVASLNEKGMKYEVIGDGESVVSQVPSSGSINKSSGTVVLYTGTAKPDDNKVSIPDLSGLTASAANSELINKGFNVKIDGASNQSDLTVTAQTPAAGEAVPRGTVVTITVRYTGGTE